ncbi:hypothetical protein CVT26_006954 [Gymnopilus dilepis]|uniref:Uncharacterized protein n=1 Tax=Gymnopilus dilepis TaxID=231916 RepID=A0A409XA07_9AGAR|nr:hypothetical protein CVT26_006954 [Gymnopilus dilepis]
MALLHWYIVPIGIELGFQMNVLKNFAEFRAIIEYAMTITPRSEDDLSNYQTTIVNFLHEFERLYVGDDPEKIYRARLCVFQLIHFPLHIKWNGSIRLGSQATVERSIGEMGRKIRSKKAPFANLSNLIYQRELIRVLALYYPEIEPSLAIRPLSEAVSVRKLFQKKRIAKSKLQSDNEISKEIEVLVTKLQIDPDDDEIKIERYGKLRLQNGHVLASRTAYEHLDPNPNRRRYEWFEGTFSSQLSVESGRKQGDLFFGNARAFYRIKTSTDIYSVVVYTPLHKDSETLHVRRGVWNTGVLEVADIQDIQALVGIWTGCTTEKVYILRKHPALVMLNEGERGSCEEGEEEDLSDAVNV